MPVSRWCPLCGERVGNMIDHLRSPAGEGCQQTPISVFPDDQDAIVGLDSIAETHRATSD